ncbi:tripartite tricarboxylate transporter permease [Thermoanaerobacterium sp. DL9XJH110]|uniref:tripartite tricarboxylate transporter permease n=1 Tax=Thermoanaerobacterium sp. DL9XJH110 TaxID=3386643 RepID=UPI003BB4E7C5
MFGQLLEGFLNVMTPKILSFLVLGVIGGIAIGSLPGLTATMGVALLLPITFGMDPVTGILLLLGIYIGAIYGGSVSAILLRTPGTPAAAATALDGFELAKRGEAGRALGISTIASFGGGVISTVFLITIAPFLAKMALKFSAPEYFALAFFGLSIISSISGKSLLKGLIVGVLGLLASTVGMDPMTSHPRFTFGNVNLLNGFSFIPVMIGLFGLSQALTNIEESVSNVKVEQKVIRVLPTPSDIKRILGTVIRSGILGTFIGSIPGAGADIAAFVSYNEAKRWSRNPDRFGTGLIEGIAAPEAGNNGVTGGAMIPLLTLGVPGDAVTAILLGALMIQGLQPGPLLFKEHSGLVYTLFSGLLIGNFIMLVVGLLGIRLFIKVLSVPKYLLTPIIFLLCFIGSYAINNSFFDVGVMLLSGIIGYVFMKLDFPASPIVLALILGPMAESNLRRSLIMSGGNIFILFTRPIAAILLFFGIVTLLAPIFRDLFKRRPTTK